MVNFHFFGGGGWSINFSFINKPFPGVWSAVGVRSSPVFLEKSALSDLLWDQPQKPDSKSQEMTSGLSTTKYRNKILIFYFRLLQVTKCVYFCMIFIKYQYISVIAKSLNFLQKKAIYFYKNVWIYSIQHNIAKM